MSSPIPKTITLPYPPSANVYWRSRAIMPKRGGRAFASTYVSPEATKYKNTVRVLCLQQHVRPLSGPIGLSLKLYRPQRTGDLDNRIKVLLDCLQEVAYGDDDQVIEIHAFRYDDKKNPRVEVTIQQLTNQEQLI